jgi:hypothetical protein
MQLHVIHTTGIILITTVLHLLNSKERPKSSVADPDPDPQGSASFGRIRIRIRIHIHIIWPDPDPHPKFLMPRPQNWHLNNLFIVEKYCE